MVEEGRFAGQLWQLAKMEKRKQGREAGGRGWHLPHLTCACTLQNINKHTKEWPHMPVSLLHAAYETPFPPHPTHTFPWRLGGQGRRRRRKEVVVGWAGRGQAGLEGGSGGISCVTLSNQSLIPCNLLYLKMRVKHYLPNCAWDSVLVNFLPVRQFLQDDMSQTVGQWV